MPRPAALAGAPSLAASLARAPPPALALATLACAVGFPRRLVGAVAPGSTLMALPSLRLHSCARRARSRDALSATLAFRCASSRAYASLTPSPLVAAWPLWSRARASRQAASSAGTAPPAARSASHSSFADAPRKMGTTTPSCRSAAPEAAACRRSVRSDEMHSCSSEGTAMPTGRGRRGCAVEGRERAPPQHDNSQPASQPTAGLRARSRPRRAAREPGQAASRLAGSQSSASRAETPVCD